MNQQAQDHINLLGKKATDKVTKFTGVISTVSFDLYGCIQVVITPEADKGELKVGSWFDVTRLDLSNDEPVMEMPEFDKGYVASGKKGAAQKPIP